MGECLKGLQCDDCIPKHVYISCKEDSTGFVCLNLVIPYYARYFGVDNSTCPKKACEIVNSYYKDKGRMEYLGVI